LKDGLAMLAEIKRVLDVPIATDIHEIDQAEPVAAVADLVQIPAFLCRQTDLIVAAAIATAPPAVWLHVKKAQFLAPWDCKNIITKARSGARTSTSCFVRARQLVRLQQPGGRHAGYRADAGLGVPVTIDATHSVQLPGADPRTNGGSTGGRREGCR
jgi:2-dehydro-3-deoxyphosphooctonate aldolase (KDO 8-P synthase)